MAEWLELLARVDWIFIIGATLLMMLVNNVWYAKRAFGKKYFEWMGIQDQNGDGIKDGMGLAMLLEALSRFLVACGLYLFLDSGAEVTSDRTAGVGFIVAIYLLFVAPTILSDVVRSSTKSKHVFWIGAIGHLLGILSSVGLYYLFLALR